MSPAKRDQSGDKKLFGEFSNIKFRKLYKSRWQGLVCAGGVKNILFLFQAKQDWCLSSDAESKTERRIQCSHERGSPLVVEVKSEIFFQNWRIGSPRTFVLIFHVRRMGSAFWRESLIGGIWRDQSAKKCKNFCLTCPLPKLFFVIHFLSQEKSGCVHSDIFLFGVDQWQHRLILNCELCRWGGSRGSKDSSISDHVTSSLAYSLLHNAGKHYLTEIPDTYFLQDICSLRNKNIEMTFLVKLIHWH